MTLVFAWRRAAIRIPRRQFKLIFLALLVGACVAQQAPSSGVTESGIFYLDQGNGEPVVFVHGFSQTRRMWQQTTVFEDLQQDYRIILVDLLGHGDSRKPYNPEEYGKNIENELIAVLDHLRIEKAHFVGFSMGANVVGGLMVSYPERVQTAALGSGLFTNWRPAEEKFAQFTESRAKSGERYPWEPENQDFNALAAVIRGMEFASVGDDEIKRISTPAIVAFGSVEFPNLDKTDQKRLTTLPTSISSITIDGADHDSSSAAILTQEFSYAVRKLIQSNPIE